MHQPPRVLLIDDDSQLQDLFATKLRAAGFDVIQGFNGKEGYELAQKESPDLILLDLKMPAMDGAETLSALKKDTQTKDIKVIILSSFNDWSSVKMDQRAAEGMGALDFLEKGIDLNALVDKVRSVLGSQS